MLAASALQAPLNKIKNLYRNYLLIKDKDLIETHKTISKINAAIGKTIEDKKNPMVYRP